MSVPTPEAFHTQIEQTADFIATQAQPGGVLYDIAVAKAGSAEAGYTAEEVFDIVVPPKTPGSLPTRWELHDNAAVQAKEAAAQRADDIMTAAHQLRLRRQGAPDYSAVQPGEAVVVAPDGARATSVVRRSVAAQAIAAAGIKDRTLYQLGSNRQIDPTRRDGSTNPEHQALRGMAGDYLPKGSFTAFDANLATALQEGYDISWITPSPTPRAERVVELAHPDDAKHPPVVQVLPEEAGLTGGLTAIESLEAVQSRSLQGRQLVIAHNGQYVPMAELQAQEWSEANQMNMLPPVAFGDEPGDRTAFGEETITTAQRAPLIYVHEMALLGRRAADYLVDRSDLQA